MYILFFVVHGYLSLSCTVSRTIASPRKQESVRLTYSKLRVSGLVEYKRVVFDQAQYGKKE